MLPLHKATLLHLSSLPAPAVTAARYCLPIQLSDDKDSTKTRVITLLLAESFPTEVLWGNFCCFFFFFFTILRIAALTFGVMLGWKQWRLSQKVT